MNKRKQFCKWGHDTFIVGRSLGDHGSCKTCKREHNRKYLVADPDRYREYSRKYHVADPDRYREYRLAKIRDLNDAYIKQLLRRKYGHQLGFISISLGILELKRQEIACRRLLKKYKDKIKNENNQSASVAG